jgi:GT2 family glycosyltransferase
MKNVFLFCVTYHSYDYLHRFLLSVNEAARRAEGQCRVSVCVGDNTPENFQTVDTSAYQSIDVRVFPYHENLGYLGCALRMMDEVGTDQLVASDYVAISNVDLTLEPDFFQVLSALDCQGVGWLAPDIYTPRFQEHDNPYMLSRPTRRSFLKWRLMYASPLIHGLAERVYLSHRSHSAVFSESVDIYAGHGAFMLFVADFFVRRPGLKYPSFMYGEEIFLAELIRHDGLLVRYEPSLRVLNVGQVSTGLHSSVWFCRQNSRSLRVLERMFW